MMLSGAELVLLLIIVLVTVVFHKWADISKAIARARLHFDKGLSEDYIEAVVEDSDSGDDRADEADS